MYRAKRGRTDDEENRCRKIVWQRAVTRQTETRASQSEQCVAACRRAIRLGWRLCGAQTAGCCEVPFEAPLDEAVSEVGSCRCLRARAVYYFATWAAPLPIPAWRALLREPATGKATCVALMQLAYPPPAPCTTGVPVGMSHACCGCASHSAISMRTSLAFT
jgi:hypothetical protein